MYTYTSRLGCALGASEEAAFPDMGKGPVSPDEGLRPLYPMSGPSTTPS